MIFATTAGSLESVHFECVPVKISLLSQRGNKCCRIISALVKYLEGENSIALNSFDNNGHTVLDMLMISVLWSHTSMQPKQISNETPTAV